MRGPDVSIEKNGSCRKSKITARLRGLFGVMCGMEQLNLWYNVPYGTYMQISS